VPWLGAVPATTPTATRGRPSLGWILARAARTPAPADWRRWLLEDLPGAPGLLERCPAGPSRRAAQTGGRPVGTWACAEPVHLVAALDHLRLAEPVPLPLRAAESAQFVAELNQRLAGGGLTLHANPEGRWSCECQAAFDCTSPEPAQAVGGNLRDLIPSGRDARRIQAWVNEAQMVLHEHPLNESRAARGLPPVNSVWLWGFGAATAVEGATLDPLLTDDDWLAGLWRLQGAPLVTPDSTAARSHGSGTPPRVALSVRPTHEATAARLDELERELFAPLRQGLASGALSAVELHVGSELLALDRWSRWRFWRRPSPERSPP
jgi:hypothetical protein